MKKIFFEEVTKIIKNLHNQNLPDEILGIPAINPLLPRSLLDLKRNKPNFKKKIDYLTGLFFNNKNKYYLKNCDNIKIKNIIISHLVSHKNVGFLKDFYFGSLAHQLKKEKTLMILIDNLNTGRNNLKINDNIIILSKNFNIFFEIIIHFKTFIYIFYYRIFKKKIVEVNLRNIIGSIINQKIAKKIYKEIKKYNFNNIFLPYEGNPYEKIIVKKIKNKFKLKKFIFAYQHGVIRMNTFSLFLNENEDYLPDTILTVGQTNKEILSSKIPKRIKIVNVGLLKVKKIFYKKNNVESQNILVIPEGIPDEIIKMYNFCKSYRFENIKFIFRQHPIFENTNIITKKISEKIIFSKKNINYDFQRSSFVLYRGSSAVIDSVNNYLIPIYLNLGQEISLDPFYLINHSFKINNHIDLNLFIKNKIWKRKINEFNKIKLFSKKYYSRPNYNKILDSFN